ncbi:DUF5670 family protein [Hathewaya massiliensis]|uniref:DUF5670 family protein n=1 Tax=Hathewaya massiliensis TaxID=1964382 RepID=UPI00311AAF2A
MKFLRWLLCIIPFFFILGLMFKIGGKLINILLIISLIVFITDSLLRRNSII